MLDGPFGKLGEDRDHILELAVRFLVNGITQPHGGQHKRVECVSECFLVVTPAASGQAWRLQRWWYWKRIAEDLFQGGGQCRWIVFDPIQADEVVWIQVKFVQGSDLIQDVSQPVCRLLQ